MKNNAMSNKNGAYFAFTLCLITVTYGVFQARTLIHGPTLMVSSPRHGETISTVLMAINGKTENVTHVSVNGQPITMDTSGTFDETFVTPEGYGVILVEAKNRFGRHQEQRIEFIGAPQPQASTGVAGQPAPGEDEASIQASSTGPVTTAGTTQDPSATLL
ncbi:TPA: hypothetical protein DEP58_03115 [Patescibacteria group bacterium]|nr:hypothetical protein [Patescibacteria group bacterium]